MKIALSEARALLVGMGFAEKVVNGWTEEMVETKLNKIPSVYKKGKNDPKDKKLKKLLQSILDAKEEGNDIELLKDKKAGKKDKKEAKPAAKSGKKSKKDEEDEDDEEEDEDEEDEDDEEEEEKSKKKGKKDKDKKSKKGGKGGNFQSAGGSGRPGIIATILDIIQGTSKEKPTTVEKVLDRLEKKFPDRERDSMKVTVYSQLAFQMPVQKGLPIKKSGGKDGTFWWSGKPVKDKKDKKKNKK